MRRRDAPSALRSGSFGRTADGRWHWSAEAAALHGYGLGEVVPTLELLAAHQHPDDRRAFRAGVASGSAFCLRQRLTDARGNARTVVVVADRNAGALDGFFVDLTGALIAQHRALVDDALPVHAGVRGPIEQATGMLVVVYGIGPGRADALLARRAAERGLPVSRFAELLCAAVAEGVEVPARLRILMDHLLLTVHQRAQ